jgi:multiple sugar transport system ATP-binding protein
MGERIVAMREGRIQQIGSPIDLYRHPVNRFVAGFIGSPSMNFLEGRLIRNEGVAFSSGAICFPIPERCASCLQAYIGRDLILGGHPAGTYCRGVCTLRPPGTRGGPRQC